MAKNKTKQKNKQTPGQATKPDIHLGSTSPWGCRPRADLPRASLLGLGTMLSSPALLPPRQRPSQLANSVPARPPRNHHRRTTENKDYPMKPNVPREIRISPGPISSVTTRKPHLREKSSRVVVLRQTYDSVVRTRQFMSHLAIFFFSNLVLT